MRRSLRGRSKRRARVGSGRGEAGTLRGEVAAADSIFLPAPFYREGEQFAIDLPGARAVFTTRRGGVSTGSYASLNLGRYTDDRREAVEHNRASLEARFEVMFVYGRQVHGAHVRRFDRALAGGDRSAAAGGEADGHSTALAGIAPMVLTADCLPVALAGSGTVTMLHAGWRGLARGILAEGVRAARELGASGELTAAIGPGAGVCCYEVGDEVLNEFAAFGGSVHRGHKLDLKAIARLELERAGVERIHDVGLCTICADRVAVLLASSRSRDHGAPGGLRVVDLIHGTDARARARQPRAGACRDRRRRARPG